MASLEICSQKKKRLQGNNRKHEYLRISPVKDCKMDIKEKLSLIRTLKTLLKKHLGNNIKEVILFGSQVNGTSHNYSDYDVLIVLNSDYDWKYRDKITDIVYDMELDYDILIDKHLLSLNEIKYSLKGKEPIYKNAIKNGLYA
jgi:predicted nucleotidyltransferase